ncbi:MAG: carbohydrate ABC transporter permease [Formosimonas sp.]|jgi:trehalose/maltose transport system permease protein
MSKKLGYRIAFWLLVIAIVLFSVFPFYFAILTSLRTGQELYDPSLMVNSLKTINYKELLIDNADQPFLLHLWNSIMVSTLVVAVSLFISVTSAYALGRVNFKGRGLLLMVVLSVSMFPQVAVLSGMFEMMRAFGLYGKTLGLILPYMIFTLPFTVWVLTTFMRDLPKELEEAAIMDGCTPWKIIKDVFMPLMWPALVSTGLLAFIASWNEFMFALTFVNSNEARTVPVSISLLSGASQYELPWGKIMAASVIVTLPLIVMVIAFQRKIVSGLTAGAVKG